MNRSLFPGRAVSIVLGLAFLGVVFVGTYFSLIQPQDARSVQPTPEPTGAARPGVVRYIDSKGVTHYVSSLEQVPEKFRSHIKTNDLPQINRLPARAFATSTPVKQRKVEVFVTSWCPYCKALELYLKKENIAYTRYDIDRDPRARHLHLKLGGGGVPVTRIDESTVIRGYRPEEIHKAAAPSSTAAP